MPFVSVVREKMIYLQQLLSPAGIRVEGYFGGYTAAGTFDTTQLAVCTIEKANSLINKLLEQQKVNQIGCIVVDEIHMISDEGRGYILELLLTKILYVRQRYGHCIQIITMSATLPNLKLLTKWLSAEFYFTDFRPVHLREMIKIDQTIYDNQMQPIRTLDAVNPFGELLTKDPDNVAQLCLETLLEGCAVIVFCPSKDWCEKLAVQVASYVYAIGKSKSELGEKLRNQIDMAAVDEVKGQLKNCPIGMDATLGKSVSYACAYHHAGLTTDEREIIEMGFKTGTIRVLTATSTLSSGVNLPARRVIIRTPMFGGAVMNALTYRQMIGRAGRMGRDTLGESILICGKAHVMAGKELVCARVKALGSCLAAQKYVHLKRAILEIIAAGLATAKSDVEQFVNCTLLATDRECVFEYREHEIIAAAAVNRFQRNDNEDIVDAAKTDGNETTDPIAHCITFLIRFEFVRLQRSDETNEIVYVATRLGMACLAASMPPADGFLLFSELQKSRQNFVLESDLHAVYLVTPFSVCHQMVDIDWLAYLDMWERLPAAMQRVGDMVGVRESFLVRAMRGHKLDYKALQIHKRFYTALALLELVNERPMQEVAIKFKCPRGLLQSMQQMASTFAGIVTAFCQALDWQMLALIVDQFKERLFFGIHRDLIDLMRLSSLTAQRARALYADGLQTLPDLANADVFRVEKLLYNSIGFDSNQQRDGEKSFDAERRNRSRHLFITGKAGK